MTEMAGSTDKQRNSLRICQSPHEEGTTKTKSNFCEKFFLIIALAYSDNNGIKSFYITDMIILLTIGRIHLGKQYGISKTKISPRSENVNFDFDNQKDRSFCIVIFAVYSLWFLARIKKAILRKNVTLILIYLVLLKITSMKIGSFELPISDRLKLCSNNTFFFT